MLNKKLMLLTIFIVTILAVGVVSATDNATTDVVSVEQTTDEIGIVEDQVIEKMDDDDLIGVSDNGTFTALQKKIDAATAGSTIKLENDYAYDEDFNADGIVVSKDLTIDGNGHTINAMSKSGIFRMVDKNFDYMAGTTYKVVLNNLNLINGYSNNGGAIYLETDYLLRNSEPVIYSFDLTTNNCNFTNNFAEVYGGAIYGSESVYSRTLVTVFDSAFNNNHAGYGGAISADYITAVGCNFTNNSASDWGGALWVDSVKDVTNCVFTNNSARLGGAVYTDKGNISSCLFESNAASENGGAIHSVSDEYSTNIISSTFKSNAAKGNGGAVYCHEDLTVKNSQFARNSASYGAAIYHNGYLKRQVYSIGYSYTSIHTCKGTIEDCDFAYNGATENGDAIYCNNYEDEMHTSLTKCRFIYKSDSSKMCYGAVINDCEYIKNETSLYVIGSFGEFGSIACSVGLTNNDIPIANANVKITLNGEVYTVVTDSNGEAELDVLLNPGDYVVCAEYGDLICYDDIYIYSTIEVNNLTGQYSKSSVSAELLYDDGAKRQVIFKIKDKTYSATTNSNGVATANVDLDAGTYTVTAVNPANNEEKQFILVISKANSKVDLASSQNRGVVTLTATLTPAGTTGNVIFNINGENKNAQIKNGKAILTLDGLEEGNYAVTASYAGDNNLNAATSNTVTFNVVDVYPILTAKDLTKTYGTSDKLVVNLIDSKGNAIANAVVNVNINGKVTPIKTDSKGQATMAIGFAPGKYTADITYAGTAQATANITVKKANPKMTAKAKTFKKSVKTKKYAITLKTNMNKVMKSTKVTIKVNKKTYTAKTNSKGKATFKITKLTKKGKYNVVITYKGNTNYNKVTKKVQIKVK